MTDQVSVIAKAEWLPGGGPWWANFVVVLRNYTNQDIVDPEIVFHVRGAQVIQNNYGLVFSQSGQRITGRLVAERKVIPARGSQEFRLAVQGDGNSPIGTDPALLPYQFTVDGMSADVPPDTVPPSVPQDVVVTGAGPRSISLRWSPATDNVLIDHYEIDCSAAGPNSLRCITSPVEDATVTGLTASTNYLLRVRAVDLAGNRSGWSQEIQHSTSAPLPDAGDWNLPRAPFVDFTAWPTPKPSVYGRESGADAFFAGFLVSLAGGDRKVYWGGQKKIVDSSDNTEHSGDATVSDYQKADIAQFAGTVVHSFGGASNVPLEAVETSVDAIVDTYDRIIANYGATHLDFDFEGGFIHDSAGQDRHVAAMVRLLQRHPELMVSYTLPVDGAPGSLVGFNDGGVRLLGKVAAAGIEPALINGMLMEFGQTSPPDAYECCVIALNGMFTHIRAIWPHWSEGKVWRRIGACPMFGRHINGKIFTTEHMRKLVRFAEDHNLGCLSGWDATRDRNQGLLQECANPDGNDLSKCTYVEQESFEFTKIICTYKGPISDGRP